MAAIASAAKSTFRLLRKATRLALRSTRRMIDARTRRVQYEREFRGSFDAYREGKGIPPLNQDLRSGS
jgi:hypothetical protein